MNKHVSKLGQSASDARRQIEDADSDSDRDVDMDDGGGIAAGAKESKKARDKEDGGNKDKPTEEEVEKLEEKLEAAQADQKNLFLIIFQR